MKLRKPDWLPEESAAGNARRELPALAAAYFGAGRKLAHGDPSEAKLHQFRLTTKHFRYALEAFRPLYGPALEVRLGQLRKVQTVLGELNDHAATRALLEASPEANHPETTKLLSALQSKADHKRAEFRRLWNHTFDAPGQQKLWERYFRNYAHEPPGRERCII